jgi:hypothetical protein
VLNPFVVAFGPVFPARMVHEVSRAEGLAERRRAHSADHAGLEAEEHRAWYVCAARGLVVKHVDAVELPIWLPHWPVCMCTMTREEAAWRQGENKREKRARRTEET